MIIDEATFQMYKAKYLTEENIQHLTEEMGKIHFNMFKKPTIADMLRADIESDLMLEEDKLTLENAENLEDDDIFITNLEGLIEVIDMSIAKLNSALDVYYDMLVDTWQWRNLERGI